MELSDLKNEINRKYEERCYHIKMQKTLSNEIIEMKKHMFSLCKHEWVVDTSDRGEHTTYICSVCELSKYDAS